MTALSRASSVQICTEVIKMIRKNMPGLGINALSLSEQTAANVPMHIEDYSNEYPQPFTATPLVELKKKKQRKPIDVGVTEIVS